MKLQNLTVIFVIIIVPIILMVSLYISSGLRTINYQTLYDAGLLTATHDAIYAFELNTTNDAYSDNAETKRQILKSSVKAFEKSLAITCGISAYNTSAIEEYVPAIVFGMYDGFYMYAPSLNPQTGKYEHNLKNYVYYSETLSDGTIIRYSLDNYVSVSGNFKGDDSDTDKNQTKYRVKEGYLIVEDEWENIKNSSVLEAKAYYDDAIRFTNWFLNTAGLKSVKYLSISTENDPENEGSLFTQHKRSIIKNKMESVLNSSITAYSKRTGVAYRMPKLSEEDWEKVYSNISMLTFFQGKSIGLTKYNGYCVLNSTNSNEYVNPNLMYFIDGTDDTAHYYHDIRCTEIKDESSLTGYKIGDFQKQKLEEPDENGKIYKYNHNALACYDCINGSIKTTQSVYDYIKNLSNNNARKKAYYTALARERYNTTKLLKTN